KDVEQLRRSLRTALVTSSGDESRICRAHRRAGCLQNTPIDPAKNFAHQLDRSIRSVRAAEIGAVNFRPGHVWWKKARAVDIPDVVGGWRLSNERRPMSQAGSA